MNTPDKDDIDRYRRNRFPAFFSMFEEVFESINQQMRETVNNLHSHMPENMDRKDNSQDETTERQLGPFIYGYSMRVGSDGKPEIQEFGNIKPNLKPENFEGLPDHQTEVAGVREPLIETNDLGDKIQIIVELPGIDKKDIKLKVTTNLVEIDVNTPERKAHKQLDLPTSINPETATSTYKNGVLDVTLEKSMP